MAYSDSEGEDEPFQLARRRKKRRELEEQTGETGDDEKTDEDLSTKDSVQTTTHRKGPKAFRAAR